MVTHQWWNYNDVRSKIVIIGVRSKIRIIICICFLSFVVELPTHGGPSCSFYLSPICVVPMVPILISTPRVLVKTNGWGICLALNNWSSACEFSRVPPAGLWRCVDLSSVDMCNSISECHNVYYNAVINESIIGLG
jgi:hypothetical protein